MSNWYLKIVGKWTAVFVGQFDRYSDEHQRFLSSGYICQNCNRTLMKRWGVANVNCYDSDGSRVSLAIARFKGKVFECPKCHYRWNIRTIL